MPPRKRRGNVPKGDTFSGVPWTRVRQRVHLCPTTATTPSEHPPHPQEPCCARASCQASSWSSLPPGEFYRVTCMRLYHLKWELVCYASCPGQACLDPRSNASSPPPPRHPPQLLLQSPVGLSPDYQVPGPASPRPLAFLDCRRCLEKGHA